MPTTLLSPDDIPAMIIRACFPSPPLNEYVIKPRLLSFG
jgi:hypothetical protein